MIVRLEGIAFRNVEEELSADDLFFGGDNDHRDDKTVFEQCFELNACSEHQ